MPTPQMSALTHYVVVGARRCRRGRLCARQWLCRTTFQIMEDVITFPALGISLPLSEIYRDTRLGIAALTLEWDSWTAMKARVTVTLKKRRARPTRQGDEGALQIARVAGVAACARARCSTSSSAGRRRQGRGRVKEAARSCRHTVIENYQVEVTGYCRALAPFWIGFVPNPAYFRQPSLL